MAGELQALPAGWCWATLEDTGDYINGFAFKPSQWAVYGKPIIRIQNLTNPEKPLNRTAANPPDNVRVVPGDLLVSWSATLDAFIWDREEAFLNQHIFRVVPESRLIGKRLLYHWLRIAIEQLAESEHLHGSTMKHINRGPFLAHRVPLPPLNEQNRIADKLEELLSDLDAGVAELNAAQAKLAQYRQSLLNAAVDGSLTAEWRKTHKPKESGADLLERILVERRRSWEEKQLAKFKEQGKTPPKGWENTYPHPVKPDTTNLPELPEGWVWASAEQLCEFITKGTTPPKSADPGERVIPFLRVTNLTRTGDLDLSDSVFVSRSTHDGFLSRSKVYPQDVLMNIVGPPLGQVSIVPDLRAEWNINQAIAIFRAVDGVTPSFLCQILLAPPIQNWLLKRAKTTAGQTNLTLELCRALPIPLPSTQEQFVITQTIESVFAESQGLQQVIEDGLMRSVAQRKNILKDAFSGRLVPQDPTDEPASVLLERIRAERAAAGSKATVKRGRKAIA